MSEQGASEIAEIFENLDHVPHVDAEPTVCDSFVVKVPDLDDIPDGTRDTSRAKFVKYDTDPIADSLDEVPQEGFHLNMKTIDNLDSEDHLEPLRSNSSSAYTRITTADPRHEDDISLDIATEHEYESDHSSVHCCSETIYDYFYSNLDADNIEDTDSVSMLSDSWSDDEEYMDAVDIDFEEEISSKEETYEDSENEPLYPGASVSLGAFMLLLSLFCTKHNIVGDGIQQLLNIIALILPHEHILSTSLHAYKMFFKKMKNPLKKHFYCKHCLFPVDQVDTLTCLNGQCGKPFSATSGNYFLEMPVIDQVKNLFSQDGFYESLSHRFNRANESSTTIYEDIYDGSLYKSYCENDGPLLKQENLSFVGNTDGAPVFKSSNVSIWPLFLIINELPYKLRMQKENMILAALWFGNKKPIMSTFFKPILDSMKQLANGVRCFAPNVGDFISKGFLICMTCDLPARSLICNCNQYNGQYSCWKCLQPGATAKTGKGHTHIFPYEKDEPKGPRRTQQSILDDATTAVNKKLNGKSNATSHGIKGPSWLMMFPRFNMSDGIAIDYMHGVLLGVQKLLLRLWFAPEFSKEHFSVSNMVTVVDEKLKMIRPTLDITRLPRSIQKDLKYWKASEFRSFLLYYGSLIMRGILNNERHAHYLLFVHAIYILLKTGSSEGDINYAEQMLFEFCKRFAELYDRRFITLNMHQLLHLSDSVRQLGPLYTNSCFSFEDKNGVLLKLIRGTQCIDNQITTGISFIQRIPELKQKCIQVGTKVQEICETIEHPYKMKRKIKLQNGMYVLGALKQKQLSIEENVAVVQFLRETPLTDTLVTFNRIEMKESVVYGLAYKRMSKRDNSAVSYVVGSNMYFGRVHFFIQFSETEYAALIEELNCDNFNNRSPFLPVKVTKKLKVIRLEAIRSGCLFLETELASQNGYVCQFPNKLESD